MTDLPFLLQKTCELDGRRTIHDVCIGMSFTTMKGHADAECRPTIGLSTAWSLPITQSMDIGPAIHPLSGDLVLLEQREQTLSHQLSLVHTQIGRLSLRPALDDDEFARLDELKELDDALSLERRNLLDRIARLRTEIGLPLVEDGRKLDGAA